MQVVVHQLLIIEEGGACVAHVLPLLAVEDVGFGHLAVPGLDEHLLHAVLDVLHVDEAVPDLVLEVRRHPQGQQLHHIRVRLLPLGLKGPGHGRDDLVYMKGNDGAVPLVHLVHTPHSSPSPAPQRGGALP